MSKGISQIARSREIPGWSLPDCEHDRFEIGLEVASRHPGKKCAYIKSIGDEGSGEDLVNSCGHLNQVCAADSFLDKRIKMTAWLKADLHPEAIGRLELNAIGDWGWYCKWNGTFDNMSDRQLTGKTEWKQYSLVIDVLPGSYSLSFGVFLIGMGKIWLDEVSIEIVDRDTSLNGLRPSPINLNFEET